MYSSLVFGMFAHMRSLLVRNWQAGFAACCVMCLLSLFLYFSNITHVVCFIGNLHSIRLQETDTHRSISVYGILLLLPANLPCLQTELASNVIPSRHTALADCHQSNFTVMAAGSTVNWIMTN